MDINLKLLTQIHNELNEIAEIAADQLFDKEVVINKFKKVIDDLNELNTIKKKAFIEYKTSRDQLYKQLENNKQIVADFTNRIEEYLNWLTQLMDYSEKEQTPPKEFLEQGKRYELNKSIKQKVLTASVIDNNLLNQVLTDYNHIHFSKQRKRWLWWNHKVFKSKLLFVFIVKVLIGVFVGGFCEEIVDYFIPSLPKFTITIIITVISIFTLDKFLDKKFDSFFWNSLRKQILQTYAQFNLYLTQIEILLESNK